MAEADDARAGLAVEVELFHVAEARDDPRHDGVAAIFGEDEVVGEKHAGVEGVALFIEKEQDVAKGGWADDLLVVLQHLAGGELEVEVDVLAGVIEKIERGPVAVGSLAGALELGRGVSVGEA